MDYLPPYARLLSIIPVRDRATAGFFTGMMTVARGSPRYS